MPATEKWALGAVNTWTTAVGTEWTGTALSSGNAIASSIVLDNTANLDRYGAVSLLAASITPTGAPFFGVYIYPLHDDTTHYGDGRFGTAAAGPPPSCYWIGNIQVVAAVGAQYGVLWGFPIPFIKYKYVIYNSAGVATAASGNTFKHMTINRNIV